MTSRRRLKFDAGRPIALLRTQGDPSGVGNVQLGYPGQVFESDAYQRVGIVVVRTVSGDAMGQRPCRIEPGVAATRRTLRRLGRASLPDSSPRARGMLRRRFHRDWI